MNAHFTIDINTIGAAEDRRRDRIIWTQRRAPSLAEQAAYAALREAGRKSAFREIRLGAQRYALCPSSLEGIEAGLSRLPPRAMTRRLNYLWSEEIEMPRGTWIGGLTPKLTLKSAMIYSRWCRMVERAHLMRAVV